jgi:glycosyltransferase involved in cell wall biosynthesis
MKRIKHQSKSIIAQSQKEKQLISVIMPVYNAEPYLSDTIRSVLDQTYANVELILINDGSTDKSSRICDSFKQKDKRITVIHTQNHGVSYARNIGLSKARGSFITFVDSDDLVPNSYVKQLAQLAELYNTDIVSCAITRDISLINKFNNSNIEGNANIIQYNSKNAILNLLYQRDIENSACAKLYKNDCIDNVLFNEKVHIAEDLQFNYFVFKNANKVTLSKSPLYYYRVREGSSMKSGFRPNRITGIDALNAICEDSNLISKEQFAAAQNRLFIEASQLLTVIPYNEKKYIILCYEKIKKLRLAVLMDSHSKVKYRIYATISFLGYRILRYTLIVKTLVIGFIRSTN